jgi:hypothetical protein
MVLVTKIDVSVTKDKSLLTKMDVVTVMVVFVAKINVL